MVEWTPEMQKYFPGHRIGFSTHEPPAEKSIVPLALAMGCEIVEKQFADRFLE
jgi:sialic acid synthase SpsE